jgi:hypothetical protein
MKRSILAMVAGLAAWILAASVLNRALRIALEGYAAAEPNMAFTPTMLVARLIIGALASLAAGAVARSIAPASQRIAWILGAMLLAAFIPEHVMLWKAFPLWYHLTFLVTLLPLVVLGAQFTQRRRPGAAAAESRQ